MVFSKHVREYAEARRDPGWEGLANIADDILKGLRKNGLQFKLDHITEGRGNCLFVAVLQQLKREPLYSGLSPAIKVLVDEMEPTKLRHLVADFVLESPLFEDMRRMSPATMDFFRTEARNPSVDADDLFIQGVALFLQLDIHLTSPSHSGNKKFQTFSGNQAERNVEKGGPGIYIGFLSLNEGKTGHFQSILPVEEPLPLIESRGSAKRQRPVAQSKSPVESPSVAPGNFESKFLGHFFTYL